VSPRWGRRDGALARLGRRDATNRIRDEQADPRGYEETPTKKDRPIPQVLYRPSDEPPGDLSMTPAIRAATSGLSAQSIALQASAHNVANVNTNGFKRQEVTMAAGASGGVGSVSVQQVDTPGVLLLESGLDGLLLQASNVDFTDETITRIAAARIYQANLVVVEAEKERLDPLLRAVA